jgi:hypothetical protein
MARIKLDTKFFRTWEARRAGVDGRQLFLQAACWASENGTGRRLPKGQIRWWSQGIARPRDVADLLVDLGLFDDLGDRYVIVSRLVCLGYREKVPAWLRRFIFKRDSHRCRQCGATDRLAIDHMFPVSLGGETTVENLQTLCGSCNSRKGAKAG